MPPFQMLNQTANLEGGDKPSRIVNPLPSHSLLHHSGLPVDVLGFQHRKNLFSSSSNWFACTNNMTSESSMSCGTNHVYPGVQSVLKYPGRDLCFVSPSSVKTVR